MDFCDDPYKMLANNIVVSYSDLEIQRILHDAKAIKRYIYREVRTSDFCGFFLDCIMTELTRAGRTKEIGKTLGPTSEFFYANLDVQRLRKDIRYYCDKYDKVIK